MLEGFTFGAGFAFALLTLHGLTEFLSWLLEKRGHKTDREEAREIAIRRTAISERIEDRLCGVETALCTICDRLEEMRDRIAAGPPCTR